MPRPPRRPCCPTRVPARARIMLSCPAWPPRPCRHARVPVRTRRAGAPWRATCALERCIASHGAACADDASNDSALPPAQGGSPIAHCSRGHTYHFRRSLAGCKLSSHPRDLDPSPDCGIIDAPGRTANGRSARWIGTWERRCRCGAEGKAGHMRASAGGHAGQFFLAPIFFVCENNLATYTRGGAGGGLKPQPHLWNRKWLHP